VLLSPQISLTLTPTIQQGVTKWDLTVDSTGRHGTYGSYPTVSIGANQPATILQVSIDNQTYGTNWAFAHDAAALWVNQGPNDPTGPSTSPQVPTAYINTTKGDTVLTFTDLNQGDPVDLHYTMNLVNGSQKSSTLVDPIIKNGGCCHVSPHPGFLPSDTTTFLAELAFAFILGALVMWLVDRFRRMQNPAQNRSRE
jgi:hypothetical protein